MALIVVLILVGLLGLLEPITLVMDAQGPFWATVREQARDRRYEIAICVFYGLEVFARCASTVSGVSSSSEHRWSCALVHLLIATFGTAVICIKVMDAAGQGHGAQVLERNSYALAVLLTSSVVAVNHIRHLLDDEPVRRRLLWRRMRRRLVRLMRRVLSLMKRWHKN